ncbi:hypothetical protein BYT27DRAFT_7260228 [Phlegmacium glaucopus]|nr:hypothetical protein BYT27DRAFT_7260228 [Phlegmacium glaucopus]
MAWLGYLAIAAPVPWTAPWRKSGPQIIITSSPAQAKESPKIDPSKLAPPVWKPNPNAVQEKIIHPDSAFALKIPPKSPSIITHIRKKFT